MTVHSQWAVSLVSLLQVHLQLQNSWAQKHIPQSPSQQSDWKAWQQYWSTYISEEKETTSAQPTQTPVENIDKDTRSYLDIPVASSETDPLAWRRVEHERFATLARKYLRICGTSVPSKKGLQPAGNMSSDSRGWFLPQNVNKLIFLAKNMKWMFMFTCCLVCAITIITVVFLVGNNRLTF